MGPTPPGGRRHHRARARLQVFGGGDLRGSCPWCVPGPEGDPGTAAARWGGTAPEGAGSPRGTSYPRQVSERRTEAAMGAELLPWVFTSGWASGINAYAVVLVMGLLGRFAGVEAIPHVLGRTDVLLAATVLFLLEMVADKIPYVDSAWDSVHTFVRPAVGATLGYLLGHESSSLDAAFSAAAGGFSALASHGVKAGIRAAVNTSPEPLSNIAVSSAED